MVGRLSLEQLVGVQIPVPQPRANPVGTRQLGFVFLRAEPRGDEPACPPPPFDSPARFP